MDLGVSKSVAFVAGAFFLAVTTTGLSGTLFQAVKRYCFFSAAVATAEHVDMPIVLGCRADDLQPAVAEGVHFC